MNYIDNLSSISCLKFCDKDTKRNGKRRLVSSKECKKDLKGKLESIFKAVDEGVDKYNFIRTIFNPESKTRGYDAGTLNTAIVECLQREFSDHWKWGKYKRFILNLPGYLFLVKKLDNKGFPMNIRTKHSISIANQAQLCLFDEDVVYEPIIYIGYQVTKTGEVVNPRLVYIDEEEIKWEMTKDNYTKNKVVDVHLETKEEKSIVSLKKQQEAKKAN